MFESDTVCSMMLQVKAESFLQEYVKFQSVLQGGRSREVDNEQTVSPQFEFSSCILGADHLVHFRFRQLFDGILVHEGEAIVHMWANGTIASITDGLQQTISMPMASSEARLSSDDAVSIIAHSLPLCGDGRCIARRMQVHLCLLLERSVIWKTGRDGDRIAYRVQLARADGTEHMGIVYGMVDAHTGEVLHLAQGGGRYTVKAQSLYSGVVRVPSVRARAGSSSSYYLEDPDRRLAVLDLTDDSASSGSVFLTPVRVKNTRNMFGAATAIADSDRWKPAATIDAMYGLQRSYDYFLAVHGRHGIDGNGGPSLYSSATGKYGVVTAGVHYGGIGGCFNAAWFGDGFVFCDGDLTEWAPLVCIDIIGHEWAHAIITYTSDMPFLHETGAVAESICNVFGAMVKRYAQGESRHTWMAAEGCYRPNVRDAAHIYLNNPASSSETPQGPYVDWYPNMIRNTEDDSGAIHANSGVGSLAYYLYAKGGSHPTRSPTVVLQGVGCDKAEKVWFLAMTAYFTSAMTYPLARQYTIKAAGALYGNTSFEAAECGRAWTAVGVEWSGGN